MRKGKVKLFKHQAMITAITVFALVISMIGGSYAIFSSTSKSDEYNVLKVGKLEISYVDTGDGYSDVLSLNGTYPISDEEGIKSEPYRFSITNTGTITADFKIKILYDEAIIEEDNCSNNLLPQNYVKYKSILSDIVLIEVLIRCISSPFTYKSVHILLKYPFTVCISSSNQKRYHNSNDI